jgi:cell division protein FtsX
MEVLTLKSFALLVLGLVICGSAARAEDLFNLDGKAYYDKDLTPAQQQQVYESNIQNFEQIKQHTIFEKEDDSITWESSIDVVNAYQQDLLALNQ